MCVRARLCKCMLRVLLCVCVLGGGGGELEGGGGSLYLRTNTIYVQNMIGPTYFQGNNTNTSATQIQQQNRSCNGI